MMKTSFNLNSDAGRAAAIANYLATKSRTTRYRVEYIRDVDDFDPYCLFDFSEEQLTLAKELVARAEEDGEYPWAYLVDEESIKKYAFLQLPGDEGFGEYALAKIDLDNPVPVYKFRLALFDKGFEEKPRMLDYWVELKDEEYAQLVEWRLWFRRYDFHSLAYAKPELFRKLINDFDSRFCEDIAPYGGPAYLVDMTELDEDVKKILELNK